MVVSGAAGNANNLRLLGRPRLLERLIMANTNLLLIQDGRNLGITALTAEAAALLRALDKFLIHGTLDGNCLWQTIRTPSDDAPLHPLELVDFTNPDTLLLKIRDGISNQDVAKLGILDVGETCGAGLVDTLFGLLGAVIGRVGVLDDHVGIGGGLNVLVILNLGLEGGDIVNFL